MKITLTSLLDSYHSYRAARANHRALRLLSYIPVVLVVAYLVLLSFPQVLFAHEMSYKGVTLYSREPFDNDIHAVLDKVDAKIAASPINNPDLKASVFFTNSSRVYSMLSLYVGGNSFGKGFAALPNQNVFINRADYRNDLVFRDSKENNQRSLSGVIAHEITHLLIKKRYGYWRNLTMPTWKKEGYSEYVGGGSTLSYEAGVKLWKANPRDGTGYQYFKYMMLVKYLLEHDKISVDELFDRDFDLKALEERVLESL